MHPTVAVLAVQGAFIEHEKRLAALGCNTVELRQKDDLALSFNALVLPGGESTVQSKLLHDLEMFYPLRERIVEGMPTFGTCAGLILLAERIDGAGDIAGLDSTLTAQRTEVSGFATLPVTVQRNGYGRQLGSFHALSKFGDEENVPMTFIRAPFITHINDNAKVEVLASIDDRIVAARADNQLGVAFHPELDSDNRVYQTFLDMIG